jgi:hypothetical protein
MSISKKNDSLACGRLNSIGPFIRKLAVLVFLFCQILSPLVTQTTANENGMKNIVQAETLSSIPSDDFFRSEYSYMGPEMINCGHNFCYFPKELYNSKGTANTKELAIAHLISKRLESALRLSISYTSKTSFLSAATYATVRYTIANGYRFTNPATVLVLPVIWGFSPFETIGNLLDAIWSVSSMATCQKFSEYSNNLNFCNTVLWPDTLTDLEVSLILRWEGFSKKDSGNLAKLAFSLRQGMVKDAMKAFTVLSYALGLPAVDKTVNYDVSNLDKLNGLSPSLITLLKGCAFRHFRKSTSIVKKTLFFFLKGQGRKKLKVLR